MNHLLKNANELQDVFRCAEVLKTLLNINEEYLSTLFGDEVFETVNWEWDAGKEWSAVLAKNGVIKDANALYNSFIANDGGGIEDFLEHMGFTTGNSFEDVYVIPPYLFALYMSSTPQLRAAVYEVYRVWIVENEAQDDWNENYFEYSDNDKSSCRGYHCVAY